MTDRPTGHIRTGRRSASAVPYTHVVGAGSLSNLPTEHLLVSVPHDQGSASSCTGFGYYKAPVEAWAASRGIVSDPVAALAGYTGGRMEGIANADAVIPDTGADPSRVIDFALRYGLLPESLRPYSDGWDSVARRLEPYDLEVAALFKVQDFAHLDLYGNALIDATVQALSQNLPVAFAMVVDEAYESLWGPNLYSGLSGGAKGNHAQCLTGFRWNAAHNGYDFRVTGSWGVNWGDSGFAWITDDFFASTYVFDVAVLRFTPVVTHLPEPTPEAP